MPFNEDGTGEMVPPERDIFLPQEVIDDLLTNPALDQPVALSETAPPDEKALAGTSTAADREDTPEFDIRHREKFSGLLYLGSLTKTFNWAGHIFKIKTLTSGELLEVALIHQSFRGTMGDSRAYVTAIVAASVITVDGKALPAPISMDPADTPFSNRYEYVRDSWFPWTVDTVFEQYNVLQAEVETILEAMGKAVPSGASTPG